MARKSNGARYEWSSMPTLDLGRTLMELQEQIVPGKPKDLSPEVRKQNGILRRKITNGTTVLHTRRYDEAGRRASAELKAQGVDTRTADGYQKWHELRYQIAGELKAGIDY